MIKLIAYIDPGTGSFAIQAAIGTFIGASYLVRKHVRGLIGKLKKGDQSELEK